MQTFRKLTYSLQIEAYKAITTCSGRAATNNTRAENSLLVLTAVMASGPSSPLAIPYPQTDRSARCYWAWAGIPTVPRMYM